MKKSIPKATEPDRWTKADRLDRALLVDELARILTSLRRSQVTAIEGRWGAGKTHTIKMLEEKLRAGGHACIYFDAWQNDGAQDPLVPLLATIDSRIEELAPPSATSTAWKATKKAGVALAAAAAPFAIGAAVNVAVAAALTKMAGETAVAIAKKVENVTEEVVKDSLRQHQREVAAREAFLFSLSKFATAWSEGAGQEGRQVFVIVDELDRCRPPFAVALLERAKHAFGTPGVQFVIGVDRAQLENSVKGEYGEATDSQGYLRRLVDLWFRLPKPPFGQYFDSLAERFDLSDALLKRGMGDGPGQVKDTVVALATGLNLPLRTVEHAVSNIDLALRMIPAQRQPWPNLLSFFAVAREVNPQAVRDFAEGEASARPLIALVEDAVGIEEYKTSIRWANLHAILRASSAYQADVKDAIAEGKQSTDGVFGPARKRIEFMQEVANRLQNMHTSHEITSGQVRRLTWAQLELVANFTRV